MSKPLFKSLPQALTANHTLGKNLTFIDGINEEKTISYTQLYHNALGVLKVLQDNNIKQGDELIIFTKNNEVFTEVFWACLFGGIIPVPIAVGISDEHRSKLFRIFSMLDRPYLYTDGENLDRLRNYANDHSQVGEFESLEKVTIVSDDIIDKSQPGVEAQITGESRAFIQFSSGSTSDPKGVILTHTNLITTIVAIGERAEYTERDISLSWMPLTHDLGLIGFHLSPIVYNMEQYLIPTDLFSRRPLIWLKKAGEHKASVLTSPNFGYKHFLKTYSAEKFGETNLSNIRVILNGAEPISIELCHEFLNTMAAHQLPRSAIYTVYGLAEACLGVSLPIPGKEFEYVCVDRHSINVGDQVKFVDEQHEDVLKFAIEGPIVIDCEVKITDFDNNSLPDNHTGEIQIKGINVMSGYYKNDEANAKVFTGDDWVNTGDVGFMHENQLVITGRTKDIIFVNGQNYYPHDLENIALQGTDLELGKVVAHGITQDISSNSELLIFVLYRKDPKDFIPTAQLIIKLVNEQMGLEVNHVIPVQRIPKTTSGKVQRHLLGNDYLSGMYSEVLALIEETDRNKPTENDLDGLSTMEQQFYKAANEVVTNKNIGINDNLFEIGISSLTLSEIHQKIDDLYPDAIDITDMFEHQSLAEIATFIETNK